MSEAKHESYEERTDRLVKQYGKRLKVMKATSHVLSLHTIIRNKNTKQNDFVYYSDQLNRLLCEEVLSVLPMKEKNVTTPTNKLFKGIQLANTICAVSVLRSGESMENALRSLIRNVKFGKILIQRDENDPNKTPKLYYSKLPNNIHSYSVILLDPMLATGGSARSAIKVVIDAGVKEENIVFMNLVSCPEGINSVFKEYPNITIVTSMIDEGLNSNKYILPGIGDFGDRFYGTDES